MSDHHILHLVVASALTGFFGDALLQVGGPWLGRKEIWGLKSYFQQHGVAESLCIATGMMTLFYILYFVVLKLPADWRYLAVYGIILDLIFRETMVFPSLKDYYHHLNYFWSGVWGAIPMVLPLVMVKLFVDKK
jgi:hypothetical protein